MAVAAWLIGHLIAAPLMRLTSTVSSIAEGDLDRRVRPSGSMEIRRLAEAVNDMNQRLAVNLNSLTQELSQRREAEAELRASEERLSTLIDQLPGTVYRCRWQPAWQMLFISAQAKQLTGYKPAALIGDQSLSYASLIAADDFESTREKIEQAVREGRPFEVHYRLFHRDGSLHWVWERGQAHYGAEHEVQWLDGVLFDISEARRAELLITTLRESIDHQIGGDYFSSLGQAIRNALRMSAAFILRYRPGQPLQRLTTSADDDQSTEALVEILRPLFEQIVERGELLLERGLHRQHPSVGHGIDGIVGIALRNTAAIPIGVLAVVHRHPITDGSAALELLRLCAPRTVAEIERAEAQAQLQTLAEQLEQRVEQRTAELRTSHQQLSQAMDQVMNSEKLASLGSLVAGVAHELSTPIGNALTSATALHSLMRVFSKESSSGQLRRSSLDRFVSEGQEAGELIERNLHRAAELINHFKQVAVDQTSARRRRFDLNTTLQEVLTTLRPQLKRTTHRIECEVPPGIEFDSFPGPLEQVITNLITNSLDHAFPNARCGTISIRAESLGASARIEYRDDGVGVPSEYLRRVFDPFFTTRLGSGGSGLGLYLVHNLVRGVLAGSLRMESTEGSGTSFYIELPLQPPQLGDGNAEVINIMHRQANG
nr:ATP-binding protein [Pseudomarimonas arenosa]